MKKIHQLLLREFLKIFIVSLILFSVIIVLVDVFINLMNYLNFKTPVSTIMMIAVYYFPKCLSLSTPIALLFSVSFSLGAMYSKNELIAVFSSGIKLIWFVMPIIISGILLSIMSFLFQEYVVIDSFQKKTKLQDQALKKYGGEGSNDNVAVYDRVNNVIYFADKYQHDVKTLINPFAVFLIDGNIQVRIDGARASWNGKAWVFEEVKVYKRDENGDYTESFAKTFSNMKMIENPRAFKQLTSDIDELKTADAWYQIKAVKESGRTDYRKLLTDFYKRFSISFLPFIVTFLSSAIGGKFKNNILLYSLIVSLLIVVVYYVFEMITNAFGKNGVVSPFLGAFLPLICFSIFGFWLFSVAKT
jgi:lipopolysaccharide export system permease protein